VSRPQLTSNRTRTPRQPAGRRRGAGVSFSPLLLSSLVHGAGLVWLAVTLAAAPPPDPAPTFRVATAAVAPDLEETPEFVEPDLPPVERPELEPETEVREDFDPEWIEDTIDSPSNPDPSPFAARVTIGLGGRARRSRAGAAASPAPVAVAEVQAMPVARPVEPVFVSAEPDHRPVALASNATPRYPRLARTRGWTGAVRLRIEVDACGDVSSATVAQSSGYPVLDRAALDAAREWRFEPAQRRGGPVAGVVLQTVRFVI